MNAYIVDDVSYYCNRIVSACCTMMTTTVNFYELTLVLKGKMTYYVNGKKVELESGDAVFLRPGESRKRDPGKVPVHYVSFNFRIPNNITLPFEAMLKSCISDDIKKLIGAYQPVYLTERFHGKEKCSNILNYILLELYDFHKLKTKNPHIINIVKYVDDHISENISLKDVADYIHLSKEYTSYLFKKETGKQVVYYINEQKILLAKKMITGEHATLTDIAERLGFENYDYFSKTFKKHTGITPLKFKSKSTI